MLFQPSVDLQTLQAVAKEKKMDYNLDFMNMLTLERGMADVGAAGDEPQTLATAHVQPRPLLFVLHWL